MSDMSERIPIVPRHPIVCPRCGQVTFHIRGLCRTCDPCAAPLLIAAADAALSADQRPALATMVAEHPDERLPARELAARGAECLRRGRTLSAVGAAGGGSSRTPRKVRKRFLSSVFFARENGC
jgi:hypothetical protein